MVILSALSAFVLCEDGDKKHPNGKAASVSITGSVSFTGVGTGALSIQQSSKTAIVNWQNFDFDGEFPTFVMPKGGSSVWRVLSGKPTKIPDRDFLKRLYREKQIYFTNPAGYLVDGKHLFNLEPPMNTGKMEVMKQNRHSKVHSTLEPQ